MAIEQEYIDIYLNQDGSLSEKSVGNVFQFTNDFIGVRMLCSYSSEDVLAFINIQLPDGSVLGEKGMMAEAEIVEEGTTWYPYTYVFPEIVTSQSGSKFSAVVVIAFRLLDKESIARSLNSTLVPITVQPSIRGLAAEINDPTAYQELLSKINQLSVNKQNVVDQTLETSSKRVPGAINEVNAKAQKAAEDAALAVETANRAESNINKAVDAANEAVRVAEGVDGKATEALENSAEAAAAAEKSAADAEAAKEAAESISGTAQQALTVANQANTKAGQAQTAASNAQAAAQAAQSTADEALEAAQNADVKVDNVTIFKTEDKVLYLNEAYAEYLKQVTYANPTIAAFSMSPSGTSVEVGTTYSPTSFTHRETNVDNISGNLTLTSNRKSGYSLDVVPSGSSATVSLSGQGLEYKLGANDSVTYTLAGESTEDTNPSGMDFSRTVTISSYFPCYYGANGSAAITNVTGLTKKNSGNIAGTYTIDVAANQYVWFVTRGTVTSVKSSGFDVPMNEPDTVNLTFGGTSYAYKAYRVAGKVTVAGSYTYTVA